ncbi:MAG TPA: ABC transporter ATP-binding protein [Methylomirabilota bacterium]|jgi:branched-chain amino acid transport system ATP-binding protein|nr:ABC transporter ATP-binding protein [Methylomirabilota bacterium]
MLTLEDVGVRYGRTRALDGVSLTVSAAEFVCLIGANGAGKTTTLKAISGLVRAAAGRIVFDGREIQRLAPQEILRRGIAHCPEGRRVFPYMTVDENLQMGAYVRTDAADVARDRERVFAHFPILAERRRQPAGTLSGGEQQMLAIGRCLMARPRLILFDEPSLGLAPTVTESVFQIISGIQREGTTVLMVEQNAYMALQLAGRAYVMETGRITLEGPARDLMHNDRVKHAYLGG